MWIFRRAVAVEFPKWNGHHGGPALVPIPPIIDRPLHPRRDPNEARLHMGLGSGKSESSASGPPVAGDPSLGRHVKFPIPSVVHGLEEDLSNIAERAKLLVVFLRKRSTTSASSNAKAT